MKLFISYILAMALLSTSNPSYAISFSKPATASISISASAKYMRISEFVKLSASDFGAVTGKKLSYFEKLSLKVLQMKMKHYGKKHGDSTLAHYYNSIGDTNLNLLWFLGGLLVPLLSLFIVQSIAAFILLSISPVVLALIIRRDRFTMRSVLLGFGIGILAVLLQVVVILLLDPF